MKSINTGENIFSVDSRFFYLNIIQQRKQPTCKQMWLLFSLYKKNSDVLLINVFVMGGGVLIDSDERGVTLF